MRRVIIIILSALSLSSCKLITGGLSYDQWQEGRRAEKVDEWAYMYGWWNDSTRVEIPFVMTIPAISLSGGISPTLAEVKKFETKEGVSVTFTPTPSGEIEFDIDVEPVEIDTVFIYDCPPVVRPSVPTPVHVPISKSNRLFIGMGKFFSGMLSLILLMLILGYGGLAINALKNVFGVFRKR